MPEFFGKSKYRVVLKYLGLLFAASYIAWNWNNISWIFDYKFLSEKTYAVLDSTNKIVGEKPKSGQKQVKIADYYDKENGIVIAKIGLDAPLILPEDYKKGDFKEADFDIYLKKGTMHYPGSPLPGEPGQTVILGHSAPPNWPELNYYKAFSRLSELETGDEILIYFEHSLYKYRVIGKSIIKPGDDYPSLTSKNSVVLFSCWPPGKNYKRIGVQAEQIN